MLSWDRAPPSLLKPAAGRVAAPAPTTTGAGLATTGAAALVGGSFSASAALSPSPKTGLARRTSAICATSRAFKAAWAGAAEATAAPNQRVRSIRVNSAARERAATACRKSGPLRPLIRDFSQPAP